MSAFSTAVYAVASALLTTVYMYAVASDLSTAAYAVASSTSLPSNQQGVFLTVMKNWDPLVSLPEANKLN